LEDYPALLPYVTYELFVHAQQAERVLASPEPIIKRFQQPGVWSRWRVLRETIPRDTTLLQYAAARGLVTWVDPEIVDTFRRNQKEETLRRRGSVASFASAASAGRSRKSYGEDDSEYM